MLRVARSSFLRARLHPGFTAGVPARARFLTDDARAKIQSAVQATPVVLFMKGTAAQPQCGFSRAAVQVLGLHQVPEDRLKTYDVLADPELRSGIKEFSDWPTVPQVYVNGEFLGGCDILLSMHQSGELEKHLQQAGVIPTATGQTASE